MPSSSLQSLIRLEWDIYHHVRQMFEALQKGKRPGKPHLKEQSIFSYLQDFNETAYLQFADEIDTETVQKLAGNALAVFRTLWRFENYVKKWTRLPGQSEMLQR